MHNKMAESKVICNFRHYESIGFSLKETEAGKSLVFFLFCEDFGLH